MAHVVRAIEEVPPELARFFKGSAVICGGVSKGEQKMEPLTHSSTAGLQAESAEERANDRLEGEQ